jgi:hypothetical protein
MLKAFLITLLVIFVLVKIGGFIFRSMFWMLGMRAQKDHPAYKQKQSRQTYRNSDGVEINYVPEKETKKRKTNFTGGEYVDYEEVK